ncbi:MAG: helix-turn-helix domain-containing protein [Cellvibrionaceae bacterium]|nr:helix-turn-helix domain-containing protein [Cellvibrionaceae bacterium]
MIETNTRTTIVDLSNIGHAELKDIKTQAKISSYHGIAGRVVDILQARVGGNSISIEDIANEMNLSKRTLQRRLQQQLISFASLRDKVRFAHAIECLLEKNMSVEGTSRYLDFSDRTSFTNAFKRWTKLSPSTFRRLYRDL